MSDDGANITVGTPTGNTIFDLNKTGQVKIQNGVGSVLDMGQNIHIKAAGNIKLEGQNIYLN